MGSALAIISMIMQAVGMVKNVQATKKAEEELHRRKSELDLEYKKDLAADFLQTPESQSALSTLTQKYIENVKRANQGAVISGASDEKTVATAEKLHQPFQALISNLAGYGAQGKETAKSRHAYQDQNIQNLIYQNDQQKIQNWTNLASNIGTAAGGFSEADASGAFNNDDWLKKLFGNIDTTRNGSWGKGVVTKNLAGYNTGNL